MVEAGEHVVLGRACSIECAPRAFQFVLFHGKHGIFSVFSRMIPFATQDHKLPLTQWPKKMMSVSIALWSNLNN